MTPEQKYFFDLTGYLHLEGVVTGDALAQAQAAADRYMQVSDEDLPPFFSLNAVNIQIDDKCNNASGYGAGTCDALVALYGQSACQYPLSLPG